MNDRYDLNRFLSAQFSSYDCVLTELKQGKKMSHWMWYIFPQIEGLGHSSTARLFSIKSKNEAKAYLAHPILGERLKNCTQLVNDIEGHTVNEIFGHPDDLKFHSSMTLFACIEGNSRIFEWALSKYYGGKPDELTLEILGALNN